MKELELHLKINFYLQEKEKIEKSKQSDHSTYGLTVAESIVSDLYNEILIDLNSNAQSISIN